MDNCVRGLWTSALRSGKWKQAKGALALGDGRRCVNGVLCDLYLLHAPHPRGRWEDSGILPGDAVFLDLGTDSRWSALLPPVVRDWAGLDDGDPMVGSEALSDLNDEGVSFPRLADRIDLHLGGQE